MIAPYLDAANIDLKFFNEDSYRKFCGGSLRPVLESIELMHQLKIWVEITTLVVPTKNDSLDELEKAAGFIAGIDKNIPWHLSRFYPNYKERDLEPTHEVVLKQARELGKRAGLKYVYVGNIYGWGNDTICPKCKKILIKREVFNVLENNIKQARCAFCHEAVAGRF
jgi:pyruvate formate lyase activating enzyme